MPACDRQTDRQAGGRTGRFAFASTARPVDAKILWRKKFVGQLLSFSQSLE